MFSGCEFDPKARRRHADDAFFSPFLNHSPILCHTSGVHHLASPLSSTSLSPEGILNASYNCLDRHFYANPDKTAIIYEADESSESREVSYAELMMETCRVANVLKQWGVKKGDAVSI